MFYYLEGTVTIMEPNLAVIDAGGVGYAFYDAGERRFFEQLLTVSGVGPKAALAILSSGSPEALALAIIGEDDKALTMAPGIGKKLAQRVILELKDKIAKETPALKMTGVSILPGGAAGGGKLSDATSALGVLGYCPAECAVALEGIDIDALTVEEIVRSVLKNSLK